jgi:glucose/mannose transport system permease protein
MSQVEIRSKKPVKSKNNRGGDTKAALLLLPSFLLVCVFVYVFIAYTVGVSLAKNWMPGMPDMSQGKNPFGTYEALFQNPRFQSDLRNSLIFTILFLLATVIAGFFIALAVHNMGRSKGFFRSVFLLPYALSFIVTGTVWRWLFNPDSGVNLFLKYSGVADMYHNLTGQVLRPEWLTSADTVGDVSVLLAKIIPGGDFIQIQLGIPLALIPVVIATSWQLLGFAMAMFLAGLVSIPDELREASMMDGATGPRYYRSIALPMLAPVAITTLVILTHVALKIFDLIYAMSGSGIGFSTDMPGIFVFESMYKALKYNTGAAASIVMLVIVSIIVVPYLIRSNRETKGH